MGYITSLLILSKTFTCISTHSCQHQISRQNNYITNESSIYLLTCGLEPYSETKRPCSREAGRHVILHSVYTFEGVSIDIIVPPSEYTSLIWNDFSGVRTPQWCLPLPLSAVCLPARPVCTFRPFCLPGHPLRTRPTSCLPRYL
ncbi:hypothetical protein BGX38DRAFT_1224192 [Terfezia claveryi]|nr:hypothetical protein BGX38DRAFT_1224192 [Terfezia claveryi]